MVLCFSNKGGHQSPVIGAWSYAIVLQLSLGLYIFFSYSKTNDFNALNGINTISVISPTTFTKFQIFGLLHAILALLSCGPFLLGHIVCKVFLLPNFILNFLQSSLCLGTTIVSCYFLQNGARTIMGKLSKLDLIPKYLLNAVIDDYDNFIIDNRRNLFVTSILSVVVSFLYKRASGFNKKTDNVTSMILMPTIVVGLALGVASVAPSIDTKLVVSGGLLCLAAFAAEIVLTFSKCRILKFLHIILLPILALMGLTSAFLFIYTIKIITAGRLDFTTQAVILTSNFNQLVNQTKGSKSSLVNVDLVKNFLMSNTEDLSSESLNFILDNGGFTLSILIVSASEIILSVFSICYLTRDLLAPKMQEDNSGK